MTQDDRVQALRQLHILDTEREPQFDEIVEFAARLCEAPISLISLVDEGRQWFKAEIGLGVRSTPIGQSICAHAIREEKILIVEDTLADSRFCDNVLCRDDPNLRFYAGAVLRTSDGHAIGSLCVLDRKPRTLTDLQASGLQVLARQVVAQLELRRAIAQVPVFLAEIDHRVKNSLAMVGGFLSSQARNAEEETVRHALELAAARVITVAELHEQIHLTAGIGAVDLRTFLSGLVTRLSRNAPAGVTLTLDADAIDLTSQQASAIGILVNEVVTNSLRHAFAQQGGRVAISARRAGEALSLAIADDGAGFSVSEARRHGTGSRVIETLTRHLRGRLDRTSDAAGTTVRIEIPLANPAGTAQMPQA